MAHDNEHYSDPEALKRLKLGFIPQRGYANLRYKWIPSYPDEIQVHRKPYEAHRTTEHILEAS